MVGVHLLTCRFLFCYQNAIRNIFGLCPYPFVAASLLSALSLISSRTLCTCQNIREAAQSCSWR